MDDFLPVAAMSALVISVINFLKYLRAKDWNGVWTTLTVWIAGVVAVFLVGESDFKSAFDFGDVSLADMNAASKLFVGLSISAFGSFAVEIKKALDGSDSAQKPDLLTGSQE